MLELQFHNRERGLIMVLIPTSGFYLVSEICSVVHLSLPTVRRTYAAANGVVSWVDFLEISEKKTESALKQLAGSR